MLWKKTLAKECGLCDFICTKFYNTQNSPIAETAEQRWPQALQAEQPWVEHPRLKATISSLHRDLACAAVCVCQTSVNDTQLMHFTVWKFYWKSYKLEKPINKWRSLLCIWMHLRRSESAACFEVSKTEGHMSKARKQISGNGPAWEQWGQIPRYPAQSCPVHDAWTLSVRCCGHSNPTHRVESTSQEQTSRANGMARQARVLAAKPDHLSSSLRAHMAEGKSWFL